MIAVDGQEVGRLDRILVEQAAVIDERLGAMIPAHREALAAALAYAEERTPAEVVRLRAMVVALEAECAALADALGDPHVTHPFEQAEDAAGPVCWCRRYTSASRHRTPARVRAELDAP